METPLWPYAVNRSIIEKDKGRLMRKNAVLEKMKCWTVKKNTKRKKAGKQGKTKEKNKAIIYCKLLFPHCYIYIYIYGPASDSLSSKNSNSNDACTCYMA